MRGANGALLDQALLLWFPGPASATGEDVAELHVHGGRAVVSALLAALGSMANLRLAEAGEFTRRAFANGRIDLAEAEGLADLIAAETESQRQSALALAEGGLGRQVRDWQKRLLDLSAQIEADLDFSDEGDVGEGGAVTAKPVLDTLRTEIGVLLDAPGAERLRDGVRVVLAGPPNSGKSSLFNYLCDREAAIVSHVAGTTRDRIEAHVALDGVPFVLIDTAGLRDSDDLVEAEGIARARAALADADLVLWLGTAQDLPEGAIPVAGKADLVPPQSGWPASAVTGEGIAALKAEILRRARELLPRPGALALNRRHKAILAEAMAELDAACEADDPLIIAEHLRAVRGQFDRLTGRAGVEDMLDALFGSLCIGK